MQNLDTVRDWIRWGSSEFTANGLYFGHGTDNAWDEAAALLLWCIYQPWSNLANSLDARLTVDERDKVFTLYRQRIEQRVPAAYLTGEAWFGGLKFNVSPEVLVPRSPIAELIKRGLQPWATVEPKRVLDLCTGSGCIGILAAKMFAAEVVLSDISPAALAVAKQNIIAHNLQNSVTAVESDLFANLPDGKYDLLVCNPPYVDASDFASMPPEFHAEPVLALQAGQDGLDLVRVILREAASFLNDDGLLVVEVGNSALALERAYPEVPFLWPEFQYGGQGVFLLTASELKVYAEHFS